jgi:hypothetical protein
MWSSGLGALRETMFERRPDLCMSMFARLLVLIVLGSCLGSAAGLAQNLAPRTDTIRSRRSFLGAIGHSKGTRQHVLLFEEHLDLTGLYLMVKQDGQAWQVWPSRRACKFFVSRTQS